MREEGAVREGERYGEGRARKRSAPRGGWGAEACAAAAGVGAGAVEGVRAGWCWGGAVSAGRRGAGRSVLPRVWMLPGSGGAGDGAGASRRLGGTAAWQDGRTAGRRDGRTAPLLYGAVTPVLRSLDESSRRGGHALPPRHLGPGRQPGTLSSVRTRPRPALVLPGPLIRRAASQVRPRSPSDAVPRPGPRPVRIRVRSGSASGPVPRVVLRSPPWGRNPVPGRRRPGAPEDDSARPGHRTDSGHGELTVSGIGRGRFSMAAAITSGKRSGVQAKAGVPRAARAAACSRS